MYFEIDSVEIPAYARPKGKGYRLVQPPATGKNGNGEPVGQVGLPHIEMNFPVLTALGWNYWSDQVAEAQYTSLTSIKAYNPHKSGADKWQTYSGTGILLHRPTYSGISFGNYLGVKVMITELS